MSIALSRVRANEFIDGIASWYVKRNGDTGYYSLGNLTEGSVEVTELGNILDTYKRPHQHALKLLAKAKLLNTEKTNMIKMLDYLCFSDLDHVISAINGVHTLSSALITNDPFFGFKASLISDSDMDKSRYIAVEADCGLTLTGTYDEWTLATNTAPTVPGSQPTTDVLHALGSIARTGEVPAGFAKVQIDDTGGTPQDVGSIRNGKFTAEFYGSLDTRKRTHCHAIKFNIEVELLQSALVEIQQAKIITNTDLDVTVTFLDGLIFTATNKLGVQWSFHMLKDMDDSSYVRLIAQGNIYSAASGSSTWDNLFS